MTDFITETWRGFHKSGYVPALTGTGFDHMVKYYELEGVLHKGTAVLEIGVGLGLCVKGFHERGCRVSALDICDEAFKGIRGFIDGAYLDEHVEDLPESAFDLAISHLVTQHMSETGLLGQFPAVIRSIKPTGRFFVQFAGSDIPEENNIAETIVGTPADNRVSMLGGRMVRTHDYAERLVNRCGGKVNRVAGMRRFPQYKSYWYWMEVTK